MQIFGVDSDPEAAAQALGDRHVVKMCLETAQILCTVSSMYGHPAPYRPTHVRHPCVRWTAEFSSNWDWLHAHGLALGREYTFRFRKQHASSRVIESLARPPEIRNPISALAPVHFTTRSLLPAYQSIVNPVAAHRLSYIREKAHVHVYAHGREPPLWLINREAYTGV